MERTEKPDRSIDADLIARCRDGDQTAWTELVTRYQRLVYSVTRTLCPTVQDAADVFQQVWLELYQQLPSLRNTEALPAWLITVTRRRTYAAFNSSARSVPLNLEPTEIAADGADPIRAIENEHAVERAMEQLPDRCRRLIELLYFNIDEPSYSDVADMLGIPVSSIGPNRARCFEKLKKLLK
jgi:RNA polymerase sigma factor (sigma-70 family)